MIYGKDGTQLFSAYDKSGVSLQSAYDVDGDLVFSSGGIGLKTMTYNCGQWYVGGGDNVPADKDAAYYALQSGMIQNANADVLFINEYWKVMSKTGRTALSMLQQYFPYIHEQGGNSGYFGRCICSKYPITQYTVHNYSNEANRYYDSCVISVDGVEITLVVTHLATDSKRNTQITELISFLSGLNRFICAGDFNPLTISNGTTTEAEDYTNIIVPLLNAGFHCANCSTDFMYTYNDNTWNGCLDNIVTSSNIQIESAYVDTTKLTDSIVDKVDHMPLIAELAIGDA